VNSGFYSRNRLFRKNFKADGEYKKEGARFFGKLNLDLVSIDTGLLPGSNIIKLDLSVYLLRAMDMIHTSDICYIHNCSMLRISMT